MKKYVVGYLSLFDYKLILHPVEAESEYEAIKKAMVEICSEEYRQDEINWQNDPEYPKDYNSLVELLANSDTFAEAIEVTNI